MTRVFDPLAATLLLVACLSAESVPIMLGLIAAAGALAVIRKAAHGWIRPMGGKRIGKVRKNLSASILTD